MNAAQIISKHNLRPTSNRVEVLKIYLKKKKAISHGELDAMTGDRFDRITLYRTLKAFENAGILHKVYDEQGTARYSTCSHDCDTTGHDDNHVHFHCTECEDTFCLENTEIPTIAIPKDLHVSSSYMVLNGVCNQCKSA